MAAGRGRSADPAQAGDRPGYDRWAVPASRATRPWGSPRATEGLRRRSTRPPRSGRTEAPAGRHAGDRPTAGSRPGRQGACDPCPTSTRVPTSERTIWWQKALASISKASNRPAMGTRAGGWRGARKPVQVGPAGVGHPPVDGFVGTGAGNPTAERPEIVLAEQGVGRRGHGTKVQRVGHVPGQPGQERIGYRRIDHQIAVPAGGGGAAGVEVGRNLLGLPHHDGRRQLTVA